MATADTLRYLDCPGRAGVMFAVAETDQMRHRRFHDGRDRFG